MKRRGDKMAKKKTKILAKPPPLPIWPDEIVTIDTVGDEDTRQRRAFSLWEMYSDKGMRPNEADEAVATVVKLSKQTVYGWRKKYNWVERYERKLLNIYQKTALANLPALKQIACTTLEAMSVSEIALREHLRKFNNEMMVYKEKILALESAGENIPPDEYPEIPVPPFPIKTFDDLEKFNKVFQLYSANIKGDDDETTLEKQVKTMSVGELMAMMKQLEKQTEAKEEPTRRSVDDIDGEE